MPIKSTEDMAKGFIDLYHQPSKYAPQGLPYDVACKKASSAHPNFKDIIDRMALERGYKMNLTEARGIKPSGVRTDFTSFKEQIYELAFGDDAINKGYSEEEVLAEMRKQSAEAYARKLKDPDAELVREKWNVYRISVGFRTVFNVDIEAKDSDHAQEQVQAKVDSLGVNSAMDELDGRFCGVEEDDILIQFEGVTE